MAGMLRLQSLVRSSAVTVMDALSGSFTSGGLFMCAGERRLQVDLQMWGYEGPLDINEELVALSFDD